MKKLFLSLIAFLLALLLLCGCSLFGSEETTVESTGNIVSEADETEERILEPWGEPFAAEGSQQQVAYAFLTSTFPGTWASLFTCEVKSKITKWGIGDGSEDDLIKAYVTYAVYATDPTEADNHILSEGNFQIGKDDYEGAVILTRYFYLQKEAAGSWQCVGFGLSW